MTATCRRSIAISIGAPAAAPTPRTSPPRLSWQRYESLPRYREQGHFAAWLFAIARSKLASHWRAGRGQTGLDELAEQGADPDLFGGVVRGQQLARLNRLLRALGADEQELIRLRYVAELPFGEMAALLGKREDAVKKSVYRLLARLHSQMENNHA